MGAFITEGHLLGLIWYFLFEMLCMQNESLNYARLTALQDLLKTLLLYQLIIVNTFRNSYKYSLLILCNL